MTWLQRIRLWLDFRRAKKRASARAYFNTEAGRELQEHLQRFGEISTRMGLSASDIIGTRSLRPDREDA